MQKWEMTLAGRPLVIETEKFAKQANAAVLVRFGDTAVLVTAVMATKAREGIDFFPLLVDYEERLYAVGKIPGGFIKREGRPPESAVLAARMIDRPIRPLFPEGFRNDVQVTATVLSVDSDNEPSLAAMIGASAALHISEIPFAGPIGGVKVGRINGNLVINPNVAEMEKTDLQLVVAGTKDAIMMVEAGANEISEDDALEAIMYGHSVIQEIVAFIEKIREQVGKPKIVPVLYQPAPEIDKDVREFATVKMVAAIKTADKLLREELIEQVKAEVRAHFQEVYADNYDASLKSIDEVLETIVYEEVRRMIAVEKIRPDGRGLTEIRPITCDVGILPRTHGSGLFTRGQTQVLTVCTLGRVSEEQILDGLGEEESKRYIHHYNFPGFSVGEVRPVRSPGRREIGHGALAERALIPVIPSEEEFPYTIRLVSEVLESNGSSSQASVCGSTLSLMDAGVPIRRPVAGVAMGLLKDGNDFAILTDIQGMEDHYGDMDFKVAGTKEGITAIQMDIKVKGIDRAILKQALAQAREGRLFILERMLSVIAEPHKELSPYAPRIIRFSIDPDRIRDVIGPGGKIIRKIVEDTGAEIDIEDDGRVFIAAIDAKAGEKAQEIIKRLTSDVEVGATYLGKVTRLMNFGAFVEILPGKEGLVHISQLAKDRVAKVEDVVNPGDEIMVKVIEIDKQGRINLSRKAVLAGEDAPVAVG
jgi:polyribonucleotide nucleotidyltransferase